MNSIINEIKESFHKGDYLIKLIYINLFIFVVCHLFEVIAFLTTSSLFPLSKFLALPAKLSTLLVHPWGLITYMFIHGGFLHIIINILCLYWFGKIFLEHFDQKKLLNLYFVGGLISGLVFVLAYNIFPVFQTSLSGSTLIGASGSIMAILLASAAYAPNYNIQLIFVGNIQIKYIAFISILVYLLQLAGSNSGGNFAHLGGALWGFLYGNKLKQDRNIAWWFDCVLDKIFTLFKSKSILKVKYKSESNISKMSDAEYNRNRKVQQQQINKILDKISKSGYESLTTEEKRILFKMGNRK